MSCLRLFYFPSFYAAICTLLLTGCEADDPEVRKELAELRTEVASSRSEIEKLRAETAALARKAQQVSFLEVSDLQSALEPHREALRQEIAVSFPEHEIVSLSIGSIETPLSAPHPYAAKLNFFLRSSTQQQEFGPFTLSLQASRDGEWLLPSGEELKQLLTAAVTPATTTSRSSRQQQSGGQRPQQAPDGTETFVIQWGDQATQPTRTTAPPARQPEPPGTGGRIVVDPGGAPAQDTRQIQW